MTPDTTTFTGEPSASPTQRIAAEDAWRAYCVRVQRENVSLREKLASVERERDDLSRRLRGKP